MSVKVKHLNNGDMVVSKGIKPIFVILVFSILIYIKQDTLIPLFTKMIFFLTNEKLQISTYILTLLVLLISIFLYRFVTLSSNFHFSSSERKLDYKIQHWFSNKNGVISINAIQGAFIQDQDHSLGDARIVLNSEKVKLPMSSISRKLSSDTSMVIEINDWLKKNKKT